MIHQWKRALLEGASDALDRQAVLGLAVLRCAADDMASAQRRPRRKRKTDQAPNATDQSSADCMLLMLLLSLVILLWCPVHNTVFDVVELRLSNRKASDRLHGLRITHAVSHEITAVF